MYTQQATGLLRENANNDPQGMSLAIWKFRRRRTATAGRSIGNLIGGLLGGGNNDNKDPRKQQQQQQKKRGGLGDMLSGL